MTSKQRKVFSSTFTTIFILCFLITFFTAPTYEAVAVVPLAEPLSTEKRTRLKEDDGLVAAARKRVPATTTERMKVFMQGVAGLPQLKIAVEGENPEHCAALANAVAEQFQERAHLKESGLAPVERAAVPNLPIRPKRLQNIIFGAILAAIFGFLLSQIVGYIEISKRSKTDLKKGE